MRYRVIVLFLFTVAFVRTYSLAQECMHTNLSRQFDYKISATRKLAGDSTYYIVKVVLSIYSKKSKKLVQKINIAESNSLYDAFKSCKTVRSYITGYRKNADVLDYDYGDLIIADLNFDGKEDFIINGGYSVDAGPTYIFYMQDSPGHFVLNEVLTDSLASFPTHINPRQKTLTQIYVSVSGYQVTKTFRYNTQTQKWRLAKWRKKKLF